MLQPGWQPGTDAVAALVTDLRLRADGEIPTELATPYLAGGVAKGNLTLQARANGPPDDLRAAAHIEGPGGVAVLAHALLHPGRGARCRPALRERRAGDRERPPAAQRRRRTVLRKALRRRLPGAPHVVRQARLPPGLWRDGATVRRPRLRPRPGIAGAADRPGGPGAGPARPRPRPRARGAAAVPRAGADHRHRHQLPRHHRHGRHACDRGRAPRQQQPGRPARQVGAAGDRRHRLEPGRARARWTWSPGAGSSPTARPSVRPRHRHLHGRSGQRPPSRLRRHQRAADPTITGLRTAPRRRPRCGGGRRPGVDRRPSPWPPGSGPTRPGSRRVARPRPVSVRPVLVFGETDPSARLTITRELSRQVALPCRSTCALPANQTYLLDLHGFRRVPRFVVQGFSNDDGNPGATVQQVLELVASPCGPRPGRRRSARSSSRPRRRVKAPRSCAAPSARQWCGEHPSPMAPHSTSRSRSSRRSANAGYPDAVATVYRGPSARSTPSAST